MSALTRKYMSKRQRACDFCRARKTACRIEGHVPCRLCALHGRQCTFVEAAQPRKRPTTSMSNEVVTSRSMAHQDEVVDPNPDVLASPRAHVPPAYIPPLDHEMVDPESHVLLQQESLMSDTSSQNLLFENLADQFFSEFGEVAPDSRYGRTYSNLEEGLSPEILLTGMEMEGSPNILNSGLTDTQLDLNGSLNPQVLGNSGDMDPYLLRSYQYDTSGAFKFKQLTIRSVCRGANPTQFLLSQPGLFSLSRQEMGLPDISYDVLREELETLVPADTGLRLIALFRRFILSQYPIFSDSLFPDPQSSPPYLLAAIYIVAQPFARFDDTLSVELAYEDLNTQALMRLVNEALRYEAHNPGLSVVQTMILLVLRPSSNPLILESSSKWSLHGELVATSQTLGLHYDPSSWDIPTWQVALRRRISSTIFALDKWLASSLGRPPLITQDTWLVSSLRPTDGYASSLSPDVWSEHVSYTKSGPLLGDVLAKLYSLRAINETVANVQKTLGISKELLTDLSNWHQELAQQSPNHSEKAACLPTICALGYHYIQMTIFRAIMRPFFANLDPRTETSETTNQEYGDQEVVDFARTGVRASTTAAANFVKDLKEENFHMFWPYWSQVAFSCICFMDLMMAISSPNTQEALAWFRDLHTVRKEIRLKSNMLPVLRLGLLRIDALFWKGVDKVLDLPPHVQDALQASLDHHNTG